MSKQFHEDGLSFDYPDDWKLEREESDNGWTATLQSPGTAFAMIQLDRDLPDPREVVEAALDALKADYPSLDADSALETVAGEMAIGHDVEFISLDVVNACRTRSFFGLAGTVFVMCQSSDVDVVEYDPMLRALVASMRLEEE